MHVPVDIQIWRLSVLALMGVGSDLLFQSYRAYRSVYRPKKLGYHLLDIVVALVSLGAIGYVVFLVNRGEMRMYVPVSLAAGFLISNVLAGSAAYKASRGLFLQVRRAMGWARRKTVEPARRAIRRGREWLQQAMKRAEEPPDEPPDGPPDGAPGDVPPEGPPEESPDRPPAEPSA